MVSEFIDEVSCLVRNGSDMAGVSLETHSDGYFNSDQLLIQVDKTINIFEQVHPSSGRISLYDKLLHIKGIG